MNIIEAIKSGKRFRRKEDPAWKTKGKISNAVWYFTEEELLTNDWEIEEPTVSITRTQFYRAAAESIKERAQIFGHVLGFTNGLVSEEYLINTSIDILAKKLGLEDK